MPAPAEARRSPDMPPPNRGEIFRIQEARPRRVLDGVRTINTREGGLIEAYVPISLIRQEDVPVDEVHVRELANSIKNESQSGLHTGQLSPVLLAEVKDSDKLVIIDGFHRVPALASLGHEEVYATIKPGTTWEEAIDLRILAATTHKSVRFSRLVEWAEQAWDRSPWADRMGISSAFTLRFLPTMTGGRSGINKEEADEIRAWVDKKCEQWHVSAPYVHRFLQTAKVADPELIKEARERRSGHKLETITPNHLGAIVKFLPDKYDMQRVVADTAREHALTVPQTRTVALAISRAKDVDEARQIAESGSWRSLEAVYKPLTKKRYSKGGNKDMERVGNHDGVLLDKFFDDQVAIAQLMVENAILTGRYVPEVNGENKKINTLLVTSDVEREDEVLGIQNGAKHDWDPEKVTTLFQTVDKLTPTLTNFLRKKGFRLHDAEDAVAVAVERFTVRVYDGRLPEEYAEEGKLQRLLVRFVNWAGVDHLREEYGRKGQKPLQISYSADAEDGERYVSETELGLSDTEDGYDVIDRKNVDFIKNLLPGLGERERRILILKGYFGLTHYEISRIIGTTEGTINVSWHGIKTKVIKLSQENHPESQPDEIVLLQK